MRAENILTVCCLALLSGIRAQPLSYGPDVVAGHRSFTYLHNINYHFTDRLKVSNLTLFDTEYQEDKNNIFFVRNTLSYNFTSQLALNGAVGVKNPGSFLTLSAQYRKAAPTGSFSYSIGATYQKGITLEQALSIEYMPYLSHKVQAYVSLLAIANVNLEGYQRGLQFIRLGVKEKLIGYGLAVNLDQFDNSRKTLENAGLFIKRSF